MDATRMFCSRRRVAALALATMALTGCASQVPVVKTQIVRVPVPVQVPCPAPALPPKPALITPSGTPSQIIKALVADLALVMGDDDQVRALAGAGNGVKVGPKQAENGTH